MLSWSDYPLVSLITVPVLTLVLMFFIRSQAHQLILRSAKLLNNQFRLASKACLRSAQRIRLRNHEVTRALAESLMERQLERRFMRIEKIVERDLSSYQQLSAQINQQLTVIEEDYAESALIPEVSPQWVTAVEAISCLNDDSRNTEVISKILEDMHATVQQHQRDALREHRWTVAARHKVLSGLRQQWRKLSKMLQHIDTNIEALRQRLVQVDQHMGQFEMLTVGSGQGIMSSMLMRFISSLCFVIVGLGAAWINWRLLNEPLLALLPNWQMEGIPLASVVAGLHIAMTLVAATLISESLRITHLFPLVSAMTRRGRQTIIFTAGSLLFALIALEALALSGAPIVAASGDMPGVSQLLIVGLGVVMPLMLSLVMIPMEYMLHSCRPVAGSLLQLLCHGLGLCLRLLGSLALHGGKLLVHGYDLIIFIPLRIEQSWQQRKNQQATGAVLKPTPADVESANVTALKFELKRGQES
ncbi:MAG: hypothetical protein WCY88_04455 [Spongiibacteraceae bacterium]